MTKISLALLFSFISTCVFADDFDFIRPSSCTFSGTFSQSKSLRGLTIPLKSEGHFYYHCEQGVVWKTFAPIQETLVFRKVLDSHTPSFRVEGEQVIVLKSRQTKLIGELMNGLIGADANYINEQFTINHRNSDLILLPKKRRINRAIKRIELSLINTDQSSSQLQISMLDRNQQWTHIRPIKQVDYSSEGDPRAQCIGVDSLTQQECDLLQNFPDQ